MTHENKPNMIYVNLTHHDICISVQKLQKFLQTPKTAFQASKKKNLQQYGNVKKTAMLHS